MSQLKQHYLKHIREQLQKELAFSHPLAVPKVTKVTVHVGIGKIAKDAQMVVAIENNIAKITGQKPVRTKSRKSISGFKLREGQEVGIMAVLRGERMYDFIDKLIHIALARVRDFRGIALKSVDGSGNLSIGLKEHIVFPEIQSEDIEHMHGIEITITTNAKHKENGMALFKALGFPFSQQ